MYILHNQDFTITASSVLNTDMTFMDIPLVVLVYSTECPHSMKMLSSFMTLEDRLKGVLTGIIELGTNRKFKRMLDIVTMEGDHIIDVVPSILVFYRGELIHVYSHMTLDAIVDGLTQLSFGSF